MKNERTEIRDARDTFVRLIVRDILKERGPMFLIDLHEETFRKANWDTTSGKPSRQFKGAPDYWFDRPIKQLYEVGEVVKIPIPGQRREKYGLREE